MYYRSGLNKAAETSYFKPSSKQGGKLSFGPTTKEVVIGLAVIGAMAYFINKI